MKINVVKDILDANDTIAQDNRNLLGSMGVLVVNITSAPGSGKTALLESTIPALDPLRCGVIVGDLQTTRDADRLVKTGADVIQVNTEGGCHLSATMVR
ncbi:MAG TPA: hydrogenase accessory protein HypB, partial [Phycisphaerae bacterium]|nr:hydrogenase accessory protein HypB [Phycisphaerae bacterium]